MTAKRSASVLADLSSRFFSTIPHDFGFKHMSQFVIRDEKTLKQKLEMVQSLGDIEIATKMMGASAKLDEHPADTNYKKLQYVCACTFPWNSMLFSPHSF